MNGEGLSGIQVVPNPTEHIRRLLERLAFQAHRAGKSPNPDAVHDLRVAIRRAEQGLVSFKDHFPRKAAKRIRKQLKRVLSCAGALRDYDIAEKVLSKMKQPGTGTLRRDFRTKRETVARSLVLILKELSLSRRIRRWREDLEFDPHQQDFTPEVLQARAMKTLPQLARRFLEAGESASADRSGARLHEFRIRTKKFRYTLEVFRCALGSTAEEWIREIKPIQAVLGAMNDYRSVLSLAAEAGCPKKIRESLRRSLQRRIRQFRGEWGQRFSGSAAAKWMHLSGQETRRVPRKPITGGVAPRGAAAATA